MTDKTDKLVERLKAKGVKVEQASEDKDTQVTFLGPKGAKAARKVVSK